MSRRVSISPRDTRAHFRILGSHRPCLSCLSHGLVTTPLIFDGVVCVNSRVVNPA
ncbi:unannotated protein [freshwater metagenome]|uniref:Unannotated protein n=1 Tax=freshwater metagenome TaxID=449393 RepID=A0A6J6K8G0_9ZZZZ